MAMSSFPPGLGNPSDPPRGVMSEQDRLAHENAVLAQNNAALHEQVRLARQNAALVAENARLAEELAQARRAGTALPLRAPPHFAPGPPPPWPDPYGMPGAYPLPIAGFPGPGYYPGGLHAGYAAGKGALPGECWTGGASPSRARFESAWSRGSTMSFCPISSSNSSYSHIEESEADDRDLRSKRRTSSLSGPTTTTMMRNIPNDYTRDLLLKLIDDAGFSGCYDLLYLPIDFKSEVGLGYAFINFISEKEAQRFKRHFEGFKNWSVPSEKICEVSWSDVVQGLHDNVQRYRNSPVMHESVPDAFKPILFKDGKRIDFPEPTKTIRPPRRQDRRPENRNAAAGGRGSWSRS